MADGQRHGSTCKNLIDIAGNKFANAVINCNCAINLGLLLRYLRGSIFIAEILIAHGALPILDVCVRSLVVYARVGKQRCYNVRLVKFRLTRLVGEILAVIALISVLLDARLRAGCSLYGEVGIIDIRH